MQLYNDFPKEVRHLYLYTHQCWLCGRNGSGRGGLEIHHIWGRCSPSALNSSCVCGTCHSHMGHSLAERERLFKITLKFLIGQGYELKKVDNEFLDYIRNDIAQMNINNL